MIDLELCTLMMYSPKDASIVFNRGRGVTFRVLDQGFVYTWTVANEMAGLLRNIHNDEDGA
ncbi:MAG: hypothetical protein CL581_14145 [Alteromonadaceae bacterium]|nr:hypothetical protein [Alteromonadaceae bacterium]